MKSAFLALMTLVCCQTLCAQGVKFYKIKSYMLEEGYTIVNNTYSDLRQGEYLYLTRTFYAGMDYMIYGFTESSLVNDIDIYVRYTDGTLYDSDEDEDATPVLLFTPTYTTTLTVRVYNVDSDSEIQKSRVRMFIGYK